MDRDWEDKHNCPARNGTQAVWFSLDLYADVRKTPISLRGLNLTLCSVTPDAFPRVSCLSETHSCHLCTAASDLPWLILTLFNDACSTEYDPVFYARQYQGITCRWHPSRTLHNEVSPKFTDVSGVYFIIRSLLEAVSTSETSVNFYDTAHCISQQTAIIILAVVRTWNLTKELSVRRQCVAVLWPAQPSTKWAPEFFPQEVKQKRPERESGYSLHLVPKFRMRGGVPLLPLYSFM
jgi:hypothetical protein